MQTPPVDSELNVSASGASERRLHVMLLVCGLALTLMLAAVYGTVGFSLS